MTSKLLNLVLALAVVILAIELTIAKKETAAQPQAADAATALDVIAQRTSVRAYDDRPVESEKVEALLRAAMAAPTARDSRPWAFVVVNDRAKLKAIADTLRGSRMAAKAQLAIVVCGDMSKALEGSGRDFWIQDASAATENLLLAATAQGLGAVWTGVYPGADRVKVCSEILNLPRHIIPLCIVPVGYPAGDVTPKDKWDSSRIHYNHW